MNPVEKYFLSRIFDHLGGDLTTYMVLREANLTKRNFDTDHKGALEDFLYPPPCSIIMWKVYKFDNNVKHSAIVDFRFDFMPFPSN